jgi:molybdopterin-biosynthesis enzyme MoeA-like protein
MVAPHFQGSDGVPPAIGLLVVGDEILSGKRADKHMAKVIELLGARGLRLAYAEFAGDAPDRLTAMLARAFASGDVVFSCGGIGATPDDHTRQSAARALGRPLRLQPEAERLIRERMQDVAREQGLPFEPDRPDNVHRLNMGMFPEGARIIPNPYNKIPGFSVGHVHFVPGFPVMAWPMVEWVLDTHYAHVLPRAMVSEYSVIVLGGMESALVPLMEHIERQHAGIKVFSLPSVDHPIHGPHIELGVKGPTAAAASAYADLVEALRTRSLELGPEMVRS